MPVSVFIKPKKLDSSAEGEKSIKKKSVYLFYQLFGFILSPLVNSLFLVLQKRKLVPKLGYKCGRAPQLSAYVGVRRGLSYTSYIFYWNKVVSLISQFLLFFWQCSTYNLVCLISGLSGLCISAGRPCPSYSPLPWL